MKGREGRGSEGQGGRKKDGQGGVEAWAQLRSLCQQRTHTTHMRLSRTCSCAGAHVPLHVWLSATGVQAWPLTPWSHTYLLATCCPAAERALRPTRLQHPPIPAPTSPGDKHAHSCMGTSGCRTARSKASTHLRACFCHASTRAGACAWRPPQCTCNTHRTPSVHPAADCKRQGHRLVGRLGWRGAHMP